MAVGLTAAAVTGGAALLGTGANAVAQGKMNRRAERFNWDMWNAQGERELDFWNMQNAFNDPSAQMERLKNAGLNPNLVYGSGADAQSAPLKSGGAPSSPNFKAPQIDLGSVAQQAMMMRQSEANIARTEAETAAIQSRTEGTEFDNALRREVGLSNYVNTVRNEQDIKEIGHGRTLAEYNAWEAANFRGKPSTDRNSPLAKAYIAGLERVHADLKSAKALGDLRTAEKVIKQFSVDLVKQGIAPNSPWYVKFMADLIGSKPVQHFLNTD